MYSVLNFKRTGFFWWGVATALIYLIPGAWLIGASSFLRSADWLQQNKPPVSWLVDVRNAIDAAAAGFPAIVQFNPQESLVVVGSLRIPNLAIGILVGLLLIVAAFFYYRHTVATPGVLDDLVAMLLIYIVLRVEGTATASVPIIQVLNDQAPKSYLFVLLIFMVYQIFRGRGAKDSAIFFKILLEALLISILILPRQTLDALAWIVEFPTKINQFLAGTQYFTSILASWAVAGLFLGIVNLYNAGKIVPPGKRPASGDADPAKKPAE